MAIIYSYPQVKPKTTDLLIGTVTYDAAGTDPVEGNPTRTFSVQDIANLAASYTLTTKQNGTSSTLTLKSDAGSLSVVNLLRGNGISLNSNGSNSITIGNLGVLSANASNTNFINMTPSAASTGNVTFSASLSASGNAGSLTYLRGDNTWSTPVTTVSTASTTFIDLTPISALNGDVQISAALSASGTPNSSKFLRGDNTWAVPISSGGAVDSVNSGIGISVDNTDPDNPIINNTGVTQIVAGNDISISPANGNGIVTINSTSQGGVTSIIAGDNITLDPATGLGDVTITSAGTTYTAGTGVEIINEVITNTAPDQTVTITGSGNATVTGTYPNFNIDVADGDVGVIAKDSFIGNGTQMDYQLSITPTSATYTEVFISGVYQEASTYTLSSDVITLSEAPAIDDTIEIVAFDLGTAGGGGGGTVDSVNGQTGVVVLDTDDIAEGATNLYDKTVSITGSGATTVTGDYPSFTVSSPAVNTDDFITNANDVYPSVNKVTDIISLTQAEYDGLTPDENAIYIIVG